MGATRRTGRNTFLFLLSAALLLSGGPAIAAPGDHVWSKGIDSSGIVTSDGADNVLLYGTFFGTVDFGGGPLTALNFLGGDVFLARYDSAGNHLWSKQFTPDMSFGTFDLAIRADAAGNIFLGGAVAGGSLDLGGGAIAGNQAFLARFDSAGNHVWSAGYGDGRIRGLDTDGTHLVVTGSTTAGVDFGGGTLGTAGANDVFVAKLTTAGAHVWSAGFGDASDQGGLGISMDAAGNVLVVGTAFGTVNFGGGPLVASFRDLFLASFTPAGAHSWSQLIAGTFSPGGGILANVGIDTGPSNEILIAGEMLGAVDFGGGALTSAGFGDVYVASFTAAGAHSWSASYGSSTGTDFASSVSVDGSGNVLVCGKYSGDTSFGGAVFPVTGNGSPFAAAYDAAGTHLYSDGFPSSVWVCDGEFTPGGDMLLRAEGGATIDFGGGPVSTAGMVVGKLEGFGGGGTTGVEALAASSVGLTASPNPFRPSTRVQYSLEAPARASLTVYDVRGRLVETLVPARRHAAGSHEVAFSASGAAGVYFVRLETETGGSTVRVVALR